MKSPKLYIGTAGWSYQDWVPNFYPKGQSKNFSWLEFYSQYFNTVEVNSTYYTYLSPKVVHGWLKQVEDADDFLFTVKLHNDFTHKHSFCKEQVAAVKHNLDILKESERFGGLLLQFPYSFECNSGNIEYLRRLISIFDTYKIFVEVRHKSWKGKKAKTVTFCTIDQPQIGESIDFETVAGNKSAYIRFHGRNEEAWLESLNNFGKNSSYEQRSTRYDYLYTPGEIVEISQQIKEIFDSVNKIFVIMNNHPRGSAVANAFEILHYLQDGIKIQMPDSILNAYPRLKKCFK